MGLSAWPVFASNRDPGLTEYLGSKPASNTAAYVTIHSGGLTVSVRRQTPAWQQHQQHVDWWVATSLLLAGAQHTHNPPCCAYVLPLPR